MKASPSMAEAPTDERHPPHTRTAVAGGVEIFGKLSKQLRLCLHNLLKVQYQRQGRATECRMETRQSGRGRLYRVVQSEYSMQRLLACGLCFLLREVRASGMSACDLIVC